VQYSFLSTFEGTSPKPVAMAGLEAAMKVCGVVAAMLPG
jgi:hypothetical protein